MGIVLFGATVVVIHIGRAVNILVNSWLLSIVGVKVPAKFQFFMWFSGLRGAIAFALAIYSLKDFESGGDIILSLTTLYAILTVIPIQILVIGGTITPLLLKLGILDESTKNLRSVETLRRVNHYISNIESKFVYPVFVDPISSDEEESELQHVREFDEIDDLESA